MVSCQPYKESFGFHVSHKRSALVSEGPKLALLCKHGLHKMKCPNAFLPNLLRYKYLLIIRFNAEMFSNRQTRRPVLNFSFFPSSWAFHLRATNFIFTKPPLRIRFLFLFLFDSELSVIFEPNFATSPQPAHLARSA